MYTFLVIVFRLTPVISSDYLLALLKSNYNNIDGPYNSNHGCDDAISCKKKTCYQKTWVITMFQSTKLYYI